jgi:hypothetical protein
VGGGVRIGVGIGPVGIRRVAGPSGVGLFGVVGRGGLGMRVGVAGELSGCGPDGTRTGIGTGMVGILLLSGLLKKGTRNPLPKLRAP